METGGRWKSVAQNPGGAGPDHPPFQVVSKVNVPHPTQLLLSLGLRNSFPESGLWGVALCQPADYLSLQQVFPTPTPRLPSKPMVLCGLHYQINAIVRGVVPDCGTRKQQRCSCLSQRSEGNSVVFCYPAQHLYFTGNWSNLDQEFGSSPDKGWQATARVKRGCVRSGFSWTLACLKADSQSEKGHGKAGGERMPSMLHLSLHSPVNFTFSSLSTDCPCSLQVSSLIFL